MSGTGPDWMNDDELLDALREALEEAADVPARFVEAGRADYTWHSIDAELAAITFDSLEVTSATRTELAPIRELTFATQDLVIQVSLAEGALRGQIVPPQPGQMEVHVRGAAPSLVEIDDRGWFAVSPAPRAPFRLLCRPSQGPNAMTDWLSP